MGEDMPGRFRQRIIFAISPPVLTGRIKRLRVPPSHSIILYLAMEKRSSLFRSMT